MQARPDYPAALNRRGALLRQLQRPAEALQSYERALQLAPDDLDLLNDLGLLLRDLKRPTEALAAFERALQLKPDFAEALSNRGLVLQEQDRFDEALAAYDRSLQLRPDLVDSHANRGNALQELARHEEALAAYERALAIKPGHESIYLNESLSRLILGDLAGGWPKYEWRWRNNSELPPQRQFAEPLWRGQEPLAGKTILIYAEQGSATRSSSAATPGRWRNAAPPCCCGCSRRSSRCCRDSKGSHASSARTSRRRASTSTARCSACRSPSAPRSRRFPPAAPTCSRRTRASPSGSPPGRRGWGRGTSPGSAWSGRATSITRTTATARSRCRPSPPSFPRARASSRCRTRSATPTRRCSKQRGDIEWFGDALVDFAETAALVAQLDLVVSVDTSVAHLAAAMGKPVWLLLPLNPDWRWLLGREDSPWYETMRLFRQTRRAEWGDVLDRVQQEIARRFA